MKSAIISLMLLSVCGCQEYTQREKWMLGAMVGANIADAYTTIEATEVDSRGGHFHELNPILGEHPDSGNVILFKAGVVAIVWGLGELFPEKREGFYLMGTIIPGGSAVINWIRNERVR